MGQVDHIDDIAFSTAFEIDKILESYSDSFSVGAGATATFTIAHSHGENVLPVMLFSDDNITWQDAGSATFAASSTTVELSGSCRVSPTQIIVSASNGAASTKTCYFKIVLIVED